MRIRVMKLELISVHVASGKRDKRHLLMFEFLTLSYNQRIIYIEHGTFSPLVFKPYGGYGRETEKVINTLSEKIAENEI